MKTTIDFPKFAKAILLNINNNFHFNIIAIDGYYGSGKTTFARKLSYALINMGYSCQTLHTDDFMRYSRDERQKTLERYMNHEGWYNLERLEEILELLNEDPMRVIYLKNIYNHTTGQLDINREIKLSNAKYVILEGDYATHQILERFITLKMILQAHHDVLLRRVVYRDWNERGLNEEFVINRYELINKGGFKKYLEEKKTVTDLVIDTSYSDEVQIEIGTRLGSQIIDSYKKIYQEPIRKIIESGDEA